MKNLVVLEWLVLMFVTQIGMGQQTRFVDFKKINATVELLPSEKKVIGTVRYTFEVLQKTDSIYLDAVNMSVSKVALEGVKAVAVKNKIWLVGSFEEEREYTTFFEYQASPKQTLYFTGDQIWTQGQGKYTSHWLPSLDDMNDKIEFDLTVVAPSTKMVIANGKLQSISESNGKNFWKYDMKKPMASYLVAFAIGDFEKQSLTSSSGVPLELYYQVKDKTKFEPTYRYTKEIFDFLETEIEVSYPWQNYKQVPVRDFLYAGMENTTATIFSEAFVVDSIGFNDRNFVNVNAHELAHQWFGNLVTEAEGTHHWLHEGFATYYALLAEKELFGEDYYYWKLFQSAEQLQALSDNGKGESLLNPKASSLTFYEKGAWALHILMEQIGEEAFKIAVKSYLKKHRYKNVITDDFLTEVRAASGQDLEQFEADWLVQSAFKAEQAYKSLLRSPFITSYFKVSALRGTSLKEKYIQMETELSFPNDYSGQEAIYQLVGEPLSETVSLYKKAFKSNNLYVRQAIALSLETIPKELKKDYESLLDDASYTTKEAALYNLWTQFPEKRGGYLDKMEGIEGFQNKNIRQLWLVLALVDPDYRSGQTNEFKEELERYTSSDYSFEIRESAFGYVNELKIWNVATLNSLVNAAVHHSWRFRKYARGLLDQLLKNQDYKALILAGMDSFSEKEKQYIKTKLEE